MDFVLRKVHEKIHRSLNSRGGAKYFSNVHSGEGAELRKDLKSTDLSRQRDAVKRVIAQMTMGRDVSYHFVDLIKLSQTEDLELKKLVYLFVLNTAKLQPDKAILAVNTFLQDVTSPSPVVRALAVRTMLCLRVPAVLAHLMQPLHSAVTDPDPYVRKTAAIGIGKIFHHNMDVFYENGFADELLKLLFDSNPLVASNAAAVVCEVNNHGKIQLKETPEWSSRILINLPEATEWGQVYLLELLSRLSQKNEESAEAVVARVLPRLNHASHAVVMGAIKVITNISNRCSTETIERVTMRINAALLTLAGASDPETQYIVYKNIHALMVIFPNILRTNLDAFYVRFNDPPYIKIEKLRLLLRLVTPSMAPAIVSELTEYITEVDMVFLEEVVSAIALLAIKIENVSTQCSDLLMKALQVHPELLPCIVIASRNIVRKYPRLLLLEPLANEYGPDSIIGEEAKTSFVWMLGEHCDFIENGQAILEQYIKSVMSHEPSVQLSILGAVIKVFLRNPSAMQAMLSTLLETLTTQSEDPDVCDRAFAYWRLLSKDVEINKMKRILESHSFSVNVDRTFSDAMMMADLKKSINTAAVVFGQPPQSFLPPYGLADVDLVDDDEGDEDEYVTDNGEESKYPTSGSTQAEASSPVRSQSQSKHNDVVGESVGKPSATHQDALDILFSTISLSSPPPALSHTTKDEKSMTSTPTPVVHLEKNQQSNPMDDLFS
ncbi:unnamed protein product [Phytomonas sp. Hart1]|nr:unnamed protein product [Phytomonas sp. Hart1]|eukprot:CCW70093.1 unnamed protein product [Phytomonas sp. isolate Hart1]